MKILKDDTKILDNLLKELEDDGIVYTDDSKRYVPCNHAKVVKCKYEAKTERYGFGITQDKKDDIYISKSNSLNAMNLDDVLVRIIDSPSHKCEGQIGYKLLGKPNYSFMQKTYSNMANKKI